MKSIEPLILQVLCIGSVSATDSSFQVLNVGDHGFSLLACFGAACSGSRAVDVKIGFT